MDQIISIKPSWGAHLFGQLNLEYSEIQIRSWCVFIKCPTENLIIQLDDVKEVAFKQGMIWSKTQLTLSTGKQIDLGGLSKAAAYALSSHILKQRELFVRAVQQLRENGPKLRKLAQWLHQGLEGKNWVAQHQLLLIKTYARTIEPVLELPVEFPKASSSILESLKTPKASKPRLTKGSSRLNWNAINTILTPLNPSL